MDRSIDRTTTWPPAIATAAFRAFRPEWGVPVRTTVGRPHRFGLPYEFASGLAPWGLVGTTLSAQAFELRYVARLDREADKIDAQLQDIAERYARQTLILLCFEARPEDCHRSIAGRWLAERYAVDIAEFGGSR